MKYIKGEPMQAKADSFWLSIDPSLCHLTVADKG